ncbi:MAG TPA: helix-turn-helix transcriptional regulator [Baekduia sp.]|nr:helix-turn-helix transcriptional regulator [Baekduia sp.]
MADTTQLPTTTLRRHELFCDIQGVLQARLGDPLTIDDVAAEVYASRRQVQRVMAEHGTSFREELTRLRVQRAAQLLRGHRAPVSAIAEQVGYRQASQFAKTFRRYMGASPSELRAMPEPGMAA